MLKTRDDANKYYAYILRIAEREGCVLEVMNELGRRDLFFLLTHLLHRKDANRDWLYQRCREVQAQPNGMLDLWAREHYKSTIITYAKTIQDVLDSHSKRKDPATGILKPASFYWERELTVGIFSANRGLAKDFVMMIKSDFEDNSLLKEVYPDVLYQNPKREAPSWSLDNGITVKRDSNPREATVEGWGLIDGMPVGKHFPVIVYDDVVTERNVTTPEQMKKMTEMWALSTNLGAEGGVERYVGTRYHFNDTYREIMARKAAEPRIHEATHDGTPRGKSVFISQEALEAKRRKQGPYVFACQMLQNPKAEDAMGFAPQWVRTYDAAEYHKGMKHWPRQWNYYLLCDPAGEKKKDNDYTVIMVIALGPDMNYYLVDGTRDRLNLVERTEKMFEFYKKYLPLKVGYEKYGKDSDIEHINYVMNQKNYRFSITPLGGAMPKNDRIRRLVPPFAERRVWLPVNRFYTNYEGKTKDLIKQFLEDEYSPFPVAVHDDMLDCFARIMDPEFGAEFPKEKSAKTPARRKWDPLNHMRRRRK